jgi:hypothetical protein
MDVVVTNARHIQGVVFRKAKPAALHVCFCRQKCYPPFASAAP